MMFLGFMIGPPIASCAADAATPTGKPNFIVILTDDQSWVGSSLQIIPDDPRTRSYYFRTPNIERLAARGMTFTQGYAPAPFCCPTRRSIQVGQTPARHLYQKDRDAWAAAYAERLNIPRLLKEADKNYIAAHFGKWDHRFDGISPYQQGYDFSDGYTSNRTGTGKGNGGPDARPDPKLIDSITDQALHFIDRQHGLGTPFYLQISHYAVHLDIIYNQATLDRVSAYPLGRKHNMPQFAAMTGDLDDGIGRVLDKLIELKLLDNTYIFFLSDNGGRNDIPKAPEIIERRNAPLRDGKGSMYEGGIRVPFIVLGPGVEAGAVSDVPVTGLDILPTLAELSDYPKALPEDIDGGSLRDVLHNDGVGDVQRADPFLIFHHAVDRDAESAIRLGDYKLVKTWKQDRIELFNLANDISEARDLSRMMPDKARELDKMLTGFLKRVGAETRNTED
jgi:arylsulfatase A-like enzyme